MRKELHDTGSQPAAAAGSRRITRDADAASAVDRLEASAIDEALADETMPFTTRGSRRDLRAASASDDRLKRALDVPHMPASAGIVAPAESALLGSLNEQIRELRVQQEQIRRMLEQAEELRYQARS